MAPLSLRYVARTDTGLRRSSNQDSGYASARLIAVADGMGGAAAGDLASATTMNIVRTVDRELDDPRTALLQAVRDANRRIGEISAIDPAVDGMGTTLEAMLWTGAHFVTAHIGDSRSYRLRAGEFTQLSHDHSFVQSLVDEGRITAQEARVHPHRSLLHRVLVGRADDEPDIGEVEGLAGDRYLLCSDGLTDMVDDAAIAEALALPSLDEAADRLIELALAGGGLDNITVVIGELVEAADEPGEPKLVGAAADRPRRRPAAAETTATIAPPPDVEELRYSYVPPSRMSWLRYGLVISVALLVLIAGAVALYRASQTEYFVGVSNDRVAIYRGVDADLPLISLNSVVQETDIPISALTRVNRDLVVEGIEARDRAEADATVARLRASRAKPKPTPTPSPSASPSSTVNPAPSTT
ncbi:MAG TPA: protein phosphatase 2C domain-containing protein [Aeromicrobium sp.]|nr:protein phosphatase 2C domain-containing protein [Aeromicrobium sp.]HKY59129.1 protein phosphatase 2C domain-containing protein [Aeromicrobium sp.]